MDNAQNEWIDGYLLRAVQPCPLFSLRSLGFKLRVGLTNDPFTYRDTDYRAMALVYSPEGKLLSQHDDLGLIRVGERHTIDTESILPKEETRNQLIYFSMIPLDQEKTSKDGKHFRANKHHLRRLIAEQSHQVEYYRDDGYASSVLISPSPFNYPKFGHNKPSTFLQAPKVFVSSELDAYLSLTNSSPELAYQDHHEISIVLSNHVGKTVAAWTENIPPFQMKLVNLKERLLTAGEDLDGTNVKTYCVSAVSETGIIYPMLFAHNPKAKTLAFEHTFPPGIYATNFFSPLRTSLNRAVRASKLFVGALR